MKKSVAIDKDLNFPTMIGEICSISLDNDLSFVDSCNVSGNFIVSGKYKMTEASRLEEEFSFNIPVEISLLENFALETSSIRITDYTYEVVDDDILRNHITILIEGVEEVTISDEDNDLSADNVIQTVEEYILEDNVDEKVVDEISFDDILDTNDERECDGNMEVEKEIPIKDNNTSFFLDEKDIDSVQVSSLNKDNNLTNKVGSLFSNLDDDDDTFKTYSIYIMREGDTLEGVMDRYKVSKEDIENYNDLGSIQINSKVIIPTGIDEE